ncbi:(2Fe-2S)-binding protein [Humitalea sp. 24SJ18S-53]|uniref:(2Fe-2S)-binding protein n=1 Tax=Humitalea sp. 24SJ18S-53 TaxID=3422307 RepID=UPI003D67C728
MLRPLQPPDPARAVPVTVDGDAVAAAPQETVAVLLLRLGRLPFRRSPVSGAPRAAYCLMGACFECLVEIDGQPRRQACMVEVAPGMRINRDVAP